MTNESFESVRPLLFSIAYRMLGSAMETDEDRIRAFHIVGNPDKLGHVGGVGPASI